MGHDLVVNVAQALGARPQNKPSDDVRSLLEKVVCDLVLVAQAIDFCLILIHFLLPFPWIFGRRQLLPSRLDRPLSVLYDPLFDLGKASFLRRFLNICVEKSHYFLSS
jgi:hypothetical protein